MMYNKATVLYVIASNLFAPHKIKNLNSMTSRIDLKENIYQTVIL